MTRLLNKLLTSPLLQGLINKNAISRLFGRLADSRSIPGPLLRKVIAGYIRAYAIDMFEYDCDLRNVTCFNEFFTRRLKPGVRVFGPGIAAPAEGCIAAYGSMAEGQLYQVKGKTYAFSDLIGAAPEIGPQASYVTIYLSPSNYHRFHAPFDMEIQRLRYLPGTLHSVSLDTLQVLERLYCRNERFVVEGRCPYGRFYYVPVGAVVVGRIRLRCTDLITNGAERGVREVVYDKPLSFAKGDEVGCFELGSTLVLAVETDALAGLDRALHSPVKLGEALCR